MTPSMGTAFSARATMLLSKRSVFFLILIGTVYNLWLQIGTATSPKDPTLLWSKIEEQVLRDRDTSKGIPKAATIHMRRLGLQKRLFENNSTVQSNRIAEDPRFRKEFAKEIRKHIEGCEHWERGGDPNEVFLPPKEDKEPSPSAPPPACKLLWFAGMTESDTCNGYMENYAAALQSARIHASDTLQPVLMLGRYPTATHMNGDRSASSLSTELSKFGEWAASQGAIVLTVQNMSFSPVIEEFLPHIDKERKIGQYLRLEIPKFVQEFHLFDLPGICPRVILYTDSDILFVNRITHAEIQWLMNRIPSQIGSSPTDVLSSSSPFVMYGRQRQMHKLQPENTGVMFFDVNQFRTEWPSLLDFGIQKKLQFVAYDQGWILDYFASTRERNKKQIILPIYWNYKAYWALNETNWKNVKVIHFHGPKPGLGLEQLAYGTIDDLKPWRDHKYFPLILRGLICNQGRMAGRIDSYYNAILPPRDEFC